MKEQILDEIAKLQGEGKRVLKLQLWSEQAVTAIHSSPEFQRGEFIGIPVEYLGRDHQVPLRDFVVITEG